MKYFYLACAIASHLALQDALAAAFALSADGAAVVRLQTKGTVGASALASSSLTSGWTATAGSGGSMSVSTYDARFKSGNGGGVIEALYNHGAALPAGKTLEWVQIVTTNDPLNGAKSPYLDNAGKPAEPFYTYTAQNRQPGLALNKLNFYDFSKRSPADLSKTDPIEWDAKLWPVLRGADKSLTVQDGISWGWRMDKATIGATAGKFDNPSPSTAVVGGVGTNAFSWGSGDPSSLNFNANAFDTKPDTEFKIGTLSFHNGTIAAGSGADAVDLTISFAFDNVPEKNFGLKAKMVLTNTPNTSDPKASADQVSIGGFNFTFNVLEGATATVDLMGKLTTGLTALPTGAKPSGAELFDSLPFDSDPFYSLILTRFANPSAGGFIGALPEPSNMLVFALGLVILLQMRWRRA